MSSFGCKNEFEKGGRIDPPTKKILLIWLEIDPDSTLEKTPINITKKEQFQRDFKCVCLDDIPSPRKNHEVSEYTDYKNAFRLSRIKRIID